MEKEKKKLLIDWLGLIVAVVSLGLTGYIFQHSSKLNRDTEISQNRPLLNIEYFKNDSEEMYGLLVKNVGKGPAIIESFRYYANRSEFEDTASIPRNSWSPEFETLWNNTNFWYDKLSTLVPGHVITPDQRSEVYLLGTRALSYNQIQEGKTSRTDRKSFYTSIDSKILDSVIVEIKYKSITSLDDSTYVLTYSESFVQNNTRIAIVERKSLPYEKGY